MNLNQEILTVLSRITKDLDILLPPKTLGKAQLSRRHDLEVTIQKLANIAIDLGSNPKTPPSPVDTDMLDIACRMTHIRLDTTTLGRISDLVDLIRERGDEVNIRDIIELEKHWGA